MPIDGVSGIQGDHRTIEGCLFKTIAGIKLLSLGIAAEERVWGLEAFLRHRQRRLFLSGNSRTS